MMEVRPVHFSPPRLQNRLGHYNKIALPWLEGNFAPIDYIEIGYRLSKPDRHYEWSLVTRLCYDKLILGFTKISNSII